MSSILVLGGAGYIGSHMVDRLVEKGQEKTSPISGYCTWRAEAGYGICNVDGYPRGDFRDDLCRCAGKRVAHKLF